MTSAQRWDETIRIVERAGDDRFYLLKTASERKKAFHEFQARQKKREREQKRAEDKRRRGAFEAMLREPSDARCGAPGFAFREVAEDLAKDARYAERFRAVVDDREKEDLYRAHCDALRVRERERRRLTRDDARRRFAERIAAPESGIDFASETWRDARRKMADLVGSHECDRYDQLVAFENAVLTTVDRDEAKRTVAELRRRVAERAARDAFVAFSRETRSEAADASAPGATSSRRSRSRRKSVPGRLAERVRPAPHELYGSAGDFGNAGGARPRRGRPAPARAGALDVAATETNAPRSAAVRRALARTNPETLVAAGEKHRRRREESARHRRRGRKGENNTHGDDDFRARLRRACLDAVAVASSEDAARRRRRRRAAEAFAALLESSPAARRAFGLDVHGGFPETRARA